MSTLLWLCIALAMQIVAHVLVVVARVRCDERYGKAAAVSAVVGLVWVGALVLNRW